jgi:hypothetical protein
MHARTPSIPHRRWGLLARWCCFYFFCECVPRKQHQGWSIPSHDMSFDIKISMNIEGNFYYYTNLNEQSEINQ